MTESFSNNVAEYNACSLASSLLNKWGTVPWSLWWFQIDCQPNQRRVWVRHEDLILYHHAAIKLANSFDGFYISHVSRLQNTKTDTLVALVATLTLPADITSRLIVVTHHLFCPKYDLEISEVHATSTNLKPRDWRFPIIDYTLHDLLPDDPKEAASIRRRSPCFYYDAVVKILSPFIQRYTSSLLIQLEAQEVLKEPHDGIYGAHQPGPKLKDRLYRLGYYWLTMIADVVEYARRCKAYQIYIDFIHQPQELLHPHSRFMVIRSVGNRYYRTHQTSIGKKSSVQPCDNQLLLKVGGRCTACWSKNH